LKRHVIVGATGKTGHRLCRILLEAGEQVRALGRNPMKLAALRAAGAECCTVEITDVAGLVEAFRGMTCAFVLAPTGPAVEDVFALHDRIGASFAKAIEAAGVPHVVMMSACGVHRPDDDNPMPGLRAIEARLAAIPGVNLALLRPGFFMENFYACFADIRRVGVLGFVIAPDIALPMIATRDIADVAARLMLERSFRGTSAYELLGPRDYTMTEATAALAASIRMPTLRYRQQNDEEARQFLRGLGYVARRSAYLLNIFRAFEAGLLDPEHPRDAASTTPTTIEAFAANEFGPAYAAVS
jgi:uncharacterized protein YbjT (DUF2867 family)